MVTLERVKFFGTFEQLKEFEKEYNVTTYEIYHYDDDMIAAFYDVENFNIEDIKKIGINFLKGIDK
jgi:hypothetical protein